MRGRDAGFQNYNAYRKLCGMKPAKKFEDFYDTIPKDVSFSYLILCTILVQPCRKDENRRVDGTCTNPHHPSRGASLTPFPRLLPAQYGPGIYPSGSHWIILNYNIFLFGDCCLNNQVPNEANPVCIPITVPQDDPFLRRTGIRCLNLTRVETFQDYGCIPHSLPAERYSRVTPLLDLSVVYGNTDERNKAIRANQGGLLAFRMEGDREVPDGNSIFCINSQPPETSCYNYGDSLQGNLLQGNYITAMWFFREHNRLARKLAELNPCWDDEKLFETARKINIAQWQYIFYYELIPLIIGRKNALSDGIIYETNGYVNDFNPSVEPGVLREYVVGSRWFHVMQPGTSDLYRKGKYVGSRTVVDDELRSGILAINNTEADLTQGCLYQPSDRADYIVDPDMSNRVLGEFQAVSDISATDMMRGRDAGFQNYNAYKKLCGLKTAKKFEDFYDTIPKDQVTKLKRIYEDVEDVELMVAIYTEKLIPGTTVGPTLYCIIAQNLILWRRSDKFFFEHGDFPTALSLDQLNEVRKTSMARVLCDNGDSVKHVQPQAFLRKTPWNDFVPCSHIPGMDLSAWMDDSCSRGNKDELSHNTNYEFN
ncbi:hypothetical protein K1T71_001580 [Dendrolimus kikuchii]|uniref:Uncharacterized protein n=1 Tax=Dendrolimus kikuchii TaxID=765133 RepID=A0ACC1DEG3_9NEOP|nr:hypothetical protein K1T71_001580 [Dendrolimus kikuchii]